MRAVPSKGHRPLGVGTGQMSCAGARGHSPYGSPASSVSRTSRRTRTSILGSISSALGTLGLSPLRPRAPYPERLLLWISHQVLAARLLFVFLLSTYPKPRIESGSARRV